ncbi:hypothetical protein ERX46_15625 [Brumimicrobium glaciale]|uniref:Uncharacterized protein n=1 Tax=Brumimicrobium glaciale TaxID=200475 RepID=A0A4Q4KH84_9FLAO|nr:alpha/beta hydrolase-fold protein [Brumimicrobium glaciale]RYM32110.1 hypothetical protein ERX46_15625 [Brumimicrobium glaciale]
MKKSILFILVLLLVTSSIFAQNYERYKNLLDTTITSENLSFDKNITVTVPFEWQKELKRDFPLIIIFDSQNERSHNYILNTIDYLTSNEQMPSSIIISVASEQQYRYIETLHEISNEKGLAAENEKFIFDELIPLAESQFNASKFRMLIGHSRYGYFTTSLLFSRINELNAIISLSPFFTQKNVELNDSIQKLKNYKTQSTKYYRFGIGNDYPEDFYKMDSVLQTLNNSSINSKGTLFKEADHNVTPGLTIAPALYEIFESWAHTQGKYMSNDFNELNKFSIFENEIKENYGSKIEFSLGALNGKGWYFYNEGQFDKAIEAWKLLIESYPNCSEAHLYILDVQIQLKQNYAKTIENFEESLANSKLYSENEKLELLKELEDLTK